MSARFTPALALALAVAQSAASPTAAAAQENAEQPKTAEEVQKAMEANQAALQKLQEKAVSVLDELQAAEDEVHALEEQAKQAEADERAAQARVDAAKRKEDGARQALVARLEELSPRLTARYRLSRRGQMNFLLSAKSTGELLKRKRMLDRILAGDLAMLRDARALLAALEGRRRELQTVEQELAERTQAAREKRAQARARKEQLALLHDQIVGERTLREKTLAELRKTAEKLGALVEDLRPQTVDGKPFKKRKGKLPFPAKGFIEVGFGKVLNPKFNTVTFQNGIDLRAPDGADVVAVAPGKVVHAGPFKGYGNLVIVDHGDGFHTLYAHLGAIERPAGTPVEQGDVLGLVGDTGSLKGPYLYFEIREGGKPIDPKPWLGSP